MPAFHDGPRSSLFTPLNLGPGNASLPDLAGVPLSEPMRTAAASAPSGACTGWGIPFEIGALIALQEGQPPVQVDFAPFQARWLVFMHTSDSRPMEKNESGFYLPNRGPGQLGEHAADYTICYADGSQEQAAIRRRHQVGAFQRRWGENCFEAVAQTKVHPMRGAQEQLQGGWGWTQTRATSADWSDWLNWLWAWENPHPEKAISGLRLAPGSGLVVLSAVTAGDVQDQPLRWLVRRKTCLRLPQGEAFQPDLDENGLLKQIQLDLGQVISAAPRLLYPNEHWTETRVLLVPDVLPGEILIEYTAHPQAAFHLAGGQVIPVQQVEVAAPDSILQSVPPSERSVRLRVVEGASGQPTAVRLHIHGVWGEYLAPVDRHRIINPDWYEDYSVDFLHVDGWENRGRGHACTYIRGETTLKLPLGKVFIEVSKGFEIKPVRRVFEITPETDEIVIELEKVLHWRERGWVTADTHVHFLSPNSALLEGAGEGVNVVNLLASQWGELMTNVGDFDGRTTHGSHEAGGDGEYLVRVGTENRQHVLGHISLLGYNGNIIAPMTTGGPDESALGDPIEILLTEWAAQCKQQNGLVVLPHFPNPRAEHAASIVSGVIDALEMTSWDDHYSGIDPYSLSDWYRYLNCGYLVAAVAGTDKMAAVTAVGTVRTYARIPRELPFTYENWKEAVRRAETFVSYGPLLEFFVNGKPMGSRIQLGANGGTLDVTWQVASTYLPVTRVELVMNGVIRESAEVDTSETSGHWRVRVEHSAWLALLVRGHHPDKPEIIAAHSSPVMALVEGSPMLAAADAVTILEQIEGALVYLDTVGTRAEDRAYRRMRLVLQSAHRSLHNRLHQQGHYHEHIE